MTYLSKIYIFLVVLSLGQVSLFAQSSWSVKGVIKEQQSGLIVPFATVKVKGEHKGTIANENGEFGLTFDQKPTSESILVFQCLGYKSLELKVIPMLSGKGNLIELEVDVVDLGEVSVSTEKRLKVKNLLKQVIEQIPLNYQSEPFTYDAYYRERVTENGVDVRFVDAAVTFTQKGYTGELSKSKAGFWGIVPLGRSAEGIMIKDLDAFYQEVHVRTRFHDHFGHKPTTENTVLIHGSRRSKNFSRQGMLANIEGGPLSTLDKDLVLDLDLFLRKSQYGKYNYDLLEIPNELGEWDYLVTFEPKRPAFSLEKVASMRESSKRIMRSDILSGSLRIDKESLAIKSIAFRVENDYRRHICSYQSQSLKHYGYEIALDYQQFDGKWQIDRVYRKDEFIFVDELKQVTTPFSSIAEIIVVEPQSEIVAVPLSKSFVNVWTNELYLYQQPYDSVFWKAYEEKYPVARILEATRTDLSKSMSLEKQFGITGNGKNKN